MILSIISTRRISFSLLPFFVIIALFFLFLGVAPASTGDSVLSMTLSPNGDMSLEARGASLGNVLAALQAETKIGCDANSQDLNKPVSLRFKSLPLEKALKRILHGINHACIYNADHRIVKVVLFADAGPDARTERGYLPDNAEFGAEPDHDSLFRGDMDSQVPPDVPTPPAEVVQAITNARAPAPPPGQ